MQYKKQTLDYSYALLTSISESWYHCDSWPNVAVSQH